MEALEGTEKVVAANTVLVTRLRLDADLQATGRSEEGLQQGQRRVLAVHVLVPTTLTDTNRMWTFIVWHGVSVRAVRVQARYPVR